MMAADFGIAPLSPALRAEISGVDITQRDDDAFQLPVPALQQPRRTRLPMALERGLYRDPG